MDENLCPECSSKMVSRKSSHGVFWGCSRFPKCKGTRDSQGRSKYDRARDTPPEDEEYPIKDNKPRWERE